MRDNVSQPAPKPSSRIETAPTSETVASTSFEYSATSNEVMPAAVKALVQTSPGGGAELTVSPLPRERIVGIKVESPPTARSSPERVIDIRKKIHHVQFRVFTDSSDYLPFGLHHLQEDFEEEKINIAKTFYNRCVSLKLEVRAYETESSRFSKTLNAEGQAFIVKLGGDSFMVTVKHNFCTEVNKDGNFEECAMYDTCFPGASKNVNPFSKELVGWNADKCQDYFEPAKWKYGIETVVALLDKKDLDGIKKIRGGIFDCFEAVNHTFEIKEGMVVGIMAHSNNGVLAKSMENQLGKGSEYKSKNGDIFITVGKITHVDANHIDYNVNTVHGFSGAPVFLLVPGEEQHMKVIAVHAGHNKCTGNNFGFLLSPQLQTPEKSASLLGKIMAMWPFSRRQHEV